MHNVKIRCPKCQWEPKPWSVWMCICNTVWNTFDTGGRCPGCGKIWKDTQCLACHKWSPHLDWYDGLDDVIFTLKKEIEESWSLPASGIKLAFSKKKRQE